MFVAAHALQRRNSRDAPPPPRGVLGPRCREGASLRSPPPAVPLTFVAPATLDLTAADGPLALKMLVVVACQCHRRCSNGRAWRAAHDPRAAAGTTTVTIQAGLTPTGGCNLRPTTLPARARITQQPPARVLCFVEDALLGCKLEVPCAVSEISYPISFHAQVDAQSLRTSQSKCGKRFHSRKVSWCMRPLVPSSVQSHAAAALPCDPGRCSL